MPMSRMNQYLKKYLYDVGYALSVSTVTCYAIYRAGKWTGESLAKWEEEKWKLKNALREERIEKLREGIRARRESAEAESKQVVAKRV